MKVAAAYVDQPTAPCYHLPTMPPRATKQQQLTVHLFKTGAGTLEEIETEIVKKIAKSAKRPESEVRQRIYPTSDSMDFKGKFILAFPSDKEPSWLPFVKMGIDVGSSKPFEIKNQSQRGILLLSVRKRLFAVTFGMARHLLPPHLLVHDFGLRTIINAVPEDSIRSVDMKQTEQISTNTRRQTSRNSSLTNFGINWSRDLVRGVTGKPSDSTFAEKLTGADALTINCRITFKQIRQKCAEILTHYDSTKYTTTQWKDIDRIRPERDEVLLTTLDSMLMAELRDGTPSDELHLALDGIEDHENVQYYSYSTDESTEDSELDIMKYLSTIEDVSELTVEKLQKHRILVKYSSSESIIPKATVYEALQWGSEYKGRYFVISGGVWFGIENDWAKKVLGTVRNINPPINSLDDPGRHITEPDFNTTATSSAPGNLLVCLDRKMVKGPTMTTFIELCDILGAQKVLYFVKPTTDVEALSYLFTQVRAGCLAFLNDSEARKQARFHINNVLNATGQQRDLSKFLAVMPEKQPIAGEYEVVLGILKERQSRWPFDISFLALASLADLHDAVVAHGFRAFSIQCLDTRPRRSVVLRRPRIR